MTAADDLAEAVATADLLAGRMRDVVARLAPYLPFDAASLATADTELPFASDALLQRFENLVNHLQDQVWRRAAVALSLRDPAEMSRRDLADAMERLGWLASADACVDVVRTRNRLSYSTPMIRCGRRAH